ncbi:hypothetical protein Q5752_006156 [Cryptotrichosporon argae]
MLRRVHLRLPLSRVAGARAPSRSASTAPRAPASDPFRPPPFRPPPLSARLRPIVPFLLYWTLITSLAVHLLRTRIRARDELARAHAQVSVLEGLVARATGEPGMSDDDVQRELEMVGLRQRRADAEEELGELRDVGWKEVLLGRRRAHVDVNDDEAVKEWVKVVNEASEAERAPKLAPAPPERAGQARRAASSNVYL